MSTIQLIILDLFILTFSLGIVLILVLCYRSDFKKQEKSIDDLFEKYGITYNEFVNMFALRDKEILRLNNRISKLEQGRNDVEN